MQSDIYRNSNNNWVYSLQKRVYLANSALVLCLTVELCQRCPPPPRETEDPYEDIRLISEISLYHIYGGKSLSYPYTVQTTRAFDFESKLTQEYCDAAAKKYMIAGVLLEIK